MVELKNLTLIQSSFFSHFFRKQKKKKKKNEKKYKPTSPHNCDSRNTSRNKNIENLRIGVN